MMEKTVLHCNHISSFRACPKSYWFRFRSNAKEHFITVEKHLGISVKTALMAYFRAQDNGNDYRLEKLLKTFEQAWLSSPKLPLKIVKKDFKLKDYYRAGRAMLKCFFIRRNRDSDQADKTLGLKSNFSLPIETKSGKTIALSGFVDRISKTKEGLLRVTQFTTGRGPYAPQNKFELLAGAVWSRIKLGEPEIEIAVDSLRSEKVYVSYLDKEYLQQLSQKLKKTAETVSHSSFPAHPSPLCSWCGFSPVCEASRTCPKCGCVMIEKCGYKGLFLGCLHPACGYTRSL